MLIRKLNVLCGFGLLSGVVYGQEKPPDLTNLGLEDLMKVEVTSASKTSQPLSNVPSAICVITQDDIRRSGATSIPEALRMAPGVDVAQIDASKWMVSIRGFNNRFADKLLVLVDGRSVYTPLFSGVSWDALDLVLEDVDRIEVIRGPGGSLWGANAVNGVINIITKRAFDTKGNQLSTVASSGEYIGAIRTGVKLAGDAAYRTYLKFSQRAPFDFDAGHPGPDQWNSAVGGFRFDKGKEDNGLMIEGNVQSSHQGQATTVPLLAPPYARESNNRFPDSDLNLTARWEHTTGSGSNQRFQSSFDQSDRENPEVAELRNTVDLDYQTRLAPSGHHVVTIGAGYRKSWDSTTGSFPVQFNPRARSEELYSGFLHDDLKLRSDMKLLFGSKIEHNNFSGWEIQPNAQLLYTPSPSRTAWASISRAVRTPARADEDSQIAFTSQPGPGGLPIVVIFQGNRNFKSEEVLANEIGYRVEPKPNLFLDASAFYNVYHHLRSIEPTGLIPSLNPVPHLDDIFTFKNLLEGQTAGVEFVAKWKVCSRWSLTGIYSYFAERLRFESGSKDPLGTYSRDGRGGAPHNQIQVRSNIDFPGHLQFDTDLYYVDALINQNAPAYWKLDCRLGWAPVRGFELSVGVRNALNPYHREAGETLFYSIEEVPRSAYVSARWRF